MTTLKEFVKVLTDYEREKIIQDYENLLEKKGIMGEDTRNILSRFEFITKTGNYPSLIMAEKLAFECYREELRIARDMLAEDFD